MKESVVRDLLGGQMIKLVTAGLQGVFPAPFAGAPFRPQGQFTVQSPVVLSQLAQSPGAQVLCFFIMETDSMLRLARLMFPKESKEEGLKLMVSANAEVLNFLSSRIAWLLAKLEGISTAELSPPRVGNFTGAQSLRLRADEGLFFDFTAKDGLAFRLAVTVQALSQAESDIMAARRA